MLITFILSIILAITSIAFLRFSPLQIGLCILIIALLTAIIFAIKISSWIAFLIFLIYIGGILIIFSYFIATTPNIKISFIFIISIITLITPTFILFLNRFSSNLIHTTQETIKESIFYNIRHIPVLTLLAILLLITLVIVVKVSNTSLGPLRPFN